MCVSNTGVYPGVCIQIPVTALLPVVHYKGSYSYGKSWNLESPFLKIMDFGTHQEKSSKLGNRRLTHQHDYLPHSILFGHIFIGEIS